MFALWAWFAFRLSCSVAKASLEQTFTVSSIPSEHSPVDFYGLEDALESFDDDFNHITLFSDACGDEIRNCTDTCLQPEQMFGNMKTLHNCWFYGSISDLWAESNLSADSVSTVEDLGFKNGGDDNNPRFRISATIRKCLSETCENIAECMDGDPAEICSLFTSPVVADVAGIGIFISYAMQMGFALLAYIFAVPWMSIMYAVYNICRTCLDVLSTRYKPSIAKERFQKSHTRKRYPEALTAALVDFQKAQCFFMLATNIAGLTMQMKGGLQPESYQQLYNTYSFIKIIAIGGFLPITFTLLTLHMVRKLSWYLLTLSVTTIAVAAASLISRSGKSLVDPTDLSALQHLASTGGPATCANFKLQTFCYNRRIGLGANLQTDSGAIYILYFCLVSTVVLIVDHFCRSPDATQQRLNRRILQKLHVASDKPLFPHAQAVLRFGTAAFYLTFFCTYILCFSTFAADLIWFCDPARNDSTWGFGQIVAILIFAPTLCDYFWNQLRGVQNGAEHRLPPHLEVRPKDEAGEGYMGGEADAVGQGAALKVDEEEKSV